MYGIWDTHTKKSGIWEDNNTKYLEAKKNKQTPDQLREFREQGFQGRV